MTQSASLNLRRRPIAGLIARSFLTGVRPRRLVSERLWEVDACRGFAVCMMIVYHFVWDLKDVGRYDIAVQSGFWGGWQIATAGLFTLLVGVSLTLSYHRAGKALPGGDTRTRVLTRGAAVFAWGLLVSLVTYLVFGPERFVRFGILHLIGVSMVFAYPLLRYRWLSLVLGAALTGTGVFLDTLNLDVPWLFWLVPTAGTGVDHQPLLPMLGPVLIGVFLGHTLFPDGNRRFRLSSLGERSPVKALRYLGQVSLLVYLVHQPILIGLLLLAGIGEWPSGSGSGT